MTREAYSKALKNLENEVVEMAAMVRKAIFASVDVVISFDESRAREVISNDKVINRKRFDIEEMCMLLIATQQPMAGDLRVLAAILHIITDLERIGDHAEGNAKIALMIGSEGPVKELDDVPGMCSVAVEMLDECVKAFVERDVEAAKKVCARDDEADAIYERIYKDLLHLMIKDPKLIQSATYLIWLAHNLERIADRATNIAERVVFMVKGKMEELNVSSY